MREMIKPSLTLLAFCIVLGFCLSVVNFMTKDTIEQRRIEELNKQINQVLTGMDEFEEVDVSTVQTSDKDILKAVHKGLKSGTASGYVFEMAPNGYGGKMTVMVGVDIEGNVTGVVLGDNNETPGLGTKAQDLSFTQQFIGIQKGTSIEVIKEEPKKDNQIQAISGATITSNAVTTAVQSAVDIANAL